MACFALSCTDLESSMTIKMEDEFGVSLWHFRLITMCPAKMAAKNGNFRSNLWQAHSTALSRNQHNFKVCSWKDKTTSLLLHGHTRTYSDTVFELGKVLVMLWTKSKFVFLWNSRTPTMPVCPELLSIHLITSMSCWQKHVSPSFYDILILD